MIIYIASSSVDYFGLAFGDGKPPEISQTLYSRLPFAENADFKHLERHVKKIVREASEKFLKDSRMRAPDMIYIVLSAPWYLCETKFVKISRRESFRIDEELLNKLMADEIELFRSKARKNFSEQNLDDLVILDKEIMRTTVNGYPLKNPLGKNTLELEVAIYLSGGRKSFLDTLRDILRHFFGDIPMKIVSEPRALFKILAGMANSEEGFLVIDVGGEVSEIYLVRRGILEGVKSFNWGGNLVARRLASLLNIELEQALSFFKLSGEGDAKPELAQKISPALEEICQDWQKLLFESLSEMGKFAPLPQTLILLPSASGSDVLAKCANSPDFASFTVLGKPFNVVTFIPENFEAKISLRGMDRKDSQMTVPLLLMLSALEYARS